MKKVPGIRPSSPQELVKASDRIGFVYLEHCTLGRDSSALTATDDRGVLHIPSATLSVLLLGPGTRVTHQSMCVLADSGAAVVWCGENGVRYYASGRPLARSTRLLEAQAQLVSNQRSRLEVARAMYEMRFEGEDTSALTMQQLRGREGARVRKIYREWSEETKVPWDKRVYDPEDYFASDPINQALSAAHICLYGVVHGVMAALGASPGLGFVHTGHDRSFVYDIADLYKAEITIPVAFKVTARCLAGEFPLDELPSRTRWEVRDTIKETHLLTRIVKDLKSLLLDEPSSESSSDFDSAEVLELWDYQNKRVAAGQNYDEESWSP